VYLFDRHSTSRLRACARAVADQLGLDYREQSITGEMRARGLYAAPGMRATSFAGWLNRFLHNLYRRSTGEAPFLAALKAHEDPPANWYQSILAQAETGMNDRHRFRREVLEALAHEQNWLLLGAANRSEWLVGWFVKGGIDDLPIQPLIDLYKTQVRQLAGQLGLPACVLANRPSPDMMPGITDEFAIGLDYATLDLALGYLQGELGENEVSASGVTSVEIEYVRELARCSAWKRTAS